MTNTKGRGPGGGTRGGGGRKPRGDSGRGGTRGLTQRVKTAKGRKLSSTRWIERQLNDPYVHKARAAGYRSRAAYKLIEIDERYPILKRGQTVVDLGAAPGGWSQVAAQRIGATDGAPVVAIDILPMDPLPGVRILHQDFFEESAPEALIEALGGRRPDVVLSDLAPETTGHRATDHLRIVNLVEMAAEFARATLAPGGTFLAKVYQGGTEGEILTALRRDFAQVRHVKPPASRPESPETYVLATGFRGTG
ncbi:RlmE family RNA methyltransferase [Acuticoccus mangrovi]|uniref:Ribosomal RNA large subunit methyltransferase E n=1 Tax=Acuticoccus mangrovi TaxID=2796142 RepID=A0A934IKM6_9HYPH|nr:RlmE family RNA methyltransferase [Acuticoccus mangrovi]MBJ3776716.1 RlmE family RNA methyltransferase [Acuticoccus mangrovi]